jgi:hypothetical protein
VRSVSGIARANVRFVGFLDSSGYRGVVTEADAVLCPTTEPGSVMRSAYEAVYACRTLIVSGWPVVPRGDGPDTGIARHRHTNREDPNAVLGECWDRVWVNEGAESYNF